MKKFWHIVSYMAWITVYAGGIFASYTLADKVQTHIYGEGD